MKKLVYLFCLTFMTMTTMTFMSCGDDDDSTFVNNDDYPTTAVHKIVIRVSGDMENFNWRTNFTALTWDGKRAVAGVVYDEKGNVLPDVVENFTYLSAETNKNATTMATAMVVSNKTVDKTGTLTVKYEGYLNGKMTNAKTYVVKGSDAIVQTIGFTTIPLED